MVQVRSVIRENFLFTLSSVSLSVSDIIAAYTFRGVTGMASDRNTRENERLGRTLRFPDKKELDENNEPSTPLSLD